MAYKRTGRPVGRPKTKEYVTLPARVPADLAELVKQYARQHGQSVAELIRDGLAWRIGDGDPRGNGMYLAQSTGTRENMYYTNTETTTGAGSAELMQQIWARHARLGEDIHALLHAIEQHTSGAASMQPASGPDQAGVVDNDGDRPAASIRAQSMLGHAPAEVDRQGQPEGFDPDKFRLGKLCKGGHAYQDTEQTLYRLPKFVCPKCDAAGARARRAAKRQVP
jgi:hypothetical protein